VCEHGKLDVDVNGTVKTVGITRVHMEEDTGKSTHVGDGGGRIHDADHTLLDFNRAGIPLVEVVTEPDIRTSDEARAYGAELQRIVLALGVSDAKLEAGSMRFDVNVSVRPIGQEELGTRTETKNVNSLRSVQRTIDFEIDRQIKVLEAGGAITQETRHWNENTGVTTSMRTKEESEDYRYFQDPDLLPLEVTPQWQAEIKATIPELPAERRSRYVAAGTDDVTAGVLGDNDDLAILFDEAVDAGASGRSVGIWLTGEVIAYSRRNEIRITETPLRPEHLVELTAMVDEGKLSSSAAKEVLIAVLDGEGNPSGIADTRDLLQVSDSGAIEAVVEQVLTENTEAVEKIRAGDMKPFGFLVGQVMRQMGGKADPKVVQQLLRDRTTA
jgi:aspartyl-tRNA(Asn)/glutamyl-tRNA(Gln) amidotransferase subunit B